LLEPASVFDELLFALLGLIAVVGFFGLRRREERRALLFIAVASYVLKAILVPAYYSFLVWDGVQGFAYLDSLGYHKSAIEMALEISLGLPHESRGWGYSDPGYNLICAILYTVFGPSTLIARLFNAAISTFTLLYVHRIARISFDAGVARVAVRLAAFLPFTILITINHRKEGVVIFVATLLFYHALRIATQQRGWARSLPILAIWLVPMYFLRGGFVLPFLGLFVVMLFLTQRSILEGGLLSVLVVVALLSLQFLFPESRELAVGRKAVEVDEMFETIAGRVQFESGLLRFVKATSPLDIWKLPLAVLVLLIMPFPPPIVLREGQPIYPLLSNFSHLIFLAFLPQFFLGLREVFRADAWKRRLPVFIYGIGFLALIGAFTSGVLRYRETVFPAVLVITAAGLRVRQNFVWSASIYVGLLLLGAYINFHRYLR
jgi:4-amino-4-deoxy-L-arabinose transferase-like glycosyltransferase